MAIPKYQQIKDELKHKIISGQFENGDKFYTEAELIDMYNVSSITVVRALNDLAKDGYIVRQQGKGTFVSRAGDHKLIEYSDADFLEGKVDEVTVLSITRDNNPEFIAKLGLGPMHYYYKIERMRTADGTPYVFHESYIPEQYINANYPELSYYSSIYDRFKFDYHIHLNDEKFEETTEILFPTESAISKRLEVAEEFPTVLQTKTTRLESTGQILEYRKTYKRGDYFKFTLLSRNQ